MAQFPFARRLSSPFRKQSRDCFASLGRAASWLDVPINLILVVETTIEKPKWLGQRVSLVSAFAEASFTKAEVTSGRTWLQKSMKEASQKMTPLIRLVGILCRLGACKVMGEF